MDGTISMTLVNAAPPAYAELAPDNHLIAGVDRLRAKVASAQAVRAGGKAADSRIKIAAPG
jgi:hypothetical protein